MLIEWFLFWNKMLIYSSLFLLLSIAKIFRSYIFKNHKKTERWREGRLTRDLKAQGMTWW